MFYVTTQIKIFNNLTGKDPHLALLLKILMNHFQIMLTMDLLNLGWTYDFSFYFLLKDYLSFLSEDYFIMDCMIQKMSGNLLVKKIIFTVILPLLLSLFIFGVFLFNFLLLYFEKRSPYKKKIYDFLVEKIRITLVVFLFILYPEILKKGFSLMNCVILDEINHIKVLAQSPNVECWTTQHTFWVLTVALPGITIWGILAPSFICIIIKIYYKNINQILHQKEYNSFMKILEGDQNQKSIILKSVIINVDNDVASKIFTIRKPTQETEIGFITKRQTFIEKKKLKIVGKKEIEAKINTPSAEKDFTIRIPPSQIKGSLTTEEKEILICRNTYKIVKEPEELINILDGLEIDCIENVKLIKEELDLTKVLVEEEYRVECDYKKKMGSKYIISSKVLNLNISTKTMIIMRNFAFIYSGYKKEYLFWELVMFSRKFIFIFIGN